MARWGGRSPGSTAGGGRREAQRGCRPADAGLGGPQGQASPLAQNLKNLHGVLETQVPSLGWEDPLEKGMETHSSILAWRIPWAEEPDRLQYMGS